MSASVALGVRLMSLLLEQLLQRADQGSLRRYDVVVHLMLLRLVLQLLVLSSTIREPSRVSVSAPQRNLQQGLQVHLYEELYQPGILLTVYERQMRSQHSYRI